MARLELRSAALRLVRGGAGAGRVRFRWRLIPVIAGGLLATLAGCAGGARQDPRIASERTAVAATQSFVSLPAGGPAIIGVIEKRYANAIVQKTILSNNSRFQGENYLTVMLYGPVVLTTYRDNTWPDDFITPSLIASETRWAFPGLVLATSPYFAQNKYGPFGYATARTTTGDLCLYAWQRIARHQGRMFLGETGTISLRLRLCAARGADEASLMHVMYGFVIDAYFLSQRWNPYGAPPPPAKELGALGAPIVPPVDTEEIATPPARTRPKPVWRDDAAEVITAPDLPPAAGSGQVDDYAAVPPPAD